MKIRLMVEIDGQDGPAADVNVKDIRIALTDRIEDNPVWAGSEAGEVGTPFDATVTGFEVIHG